MQASKVFSNLRVNMLHAKKRSTGHAHKERSQEGGGGGGVVGGGGGGAWV
jgi:hypothetical protein